MKGDGNVKATKRVACRTGSKVKVEPCYDVVAKQPGVAMIQYKQGVVFVAPAKK